MRGARLPATSIPGRSAARAAEVWPEIWEAIAPRFQQVLETGESTYLEDGLLLMHRHGYTEECYFNYSFSADRRRERRGRRHLQRGRRDDASA